MTDARRHAPATGRNRGPIAGVLDRVLPRGGTVLEIASGTGEHAVFFAERYPNVAWQPSDPDADARGSIAAWRLEQGSANLLPPIALDASAACWPIETADAILCVNMTHISPWKATEGLFAGAGRLLPPGGPLVIYGPFVEADVETVASNLAFDSSLKRRDSSWGLRDVADLDALAHGAGLERAERVAMPANNLTLVYRHL